MHDEVYYVPHAIKVANICVQLDSPENVIIFMTAGLFERLSPQVLK